MHTGNLPKHILPKYAILGYPQSDVSFQIDVPARTLYLIDLDGQGRSLTNDMKNALCRIIHFHKLSGQPVRLDEFTIFYADSAGDVTGVRVDIDYQGQLRFDFYPVTLENLGGIAS